MEPLFSVRVPAEEIIDAGVFLFQHIYEDRKGTPKTLRLLSYIRMVAKKKKLNPSRLPPTTSSARQHIMRSYLQYHNWIILDTASMNPLEWGLQLNPGRLYRPIPSKASLAPDTLLKVICCSCSVEVKAPCQS